MDSRFDAIVGPCFTALYRTAYRLAGSRADAEDLFQEVCLRAYTALDDLEDVDSPMAWLLRVQYRLFVDDTRRRKRSPVRPLDRDEELSRVLVSEDPGPEDEIDGRETGRRLQTAWVRLRKDQRALLSLVAEGYSLAEIEEITGLSNGAIRARLHRARARLATLLDEEPAATNVRAAI